MKYQLELGLMHPTLGVQVWKWQQHHVLEFGVDLSEVFVEFSRDLHLALAWLTATVVGKLRIFRGPHAELTGLLAFKAIRGSD